MKDAGDSNFDVDSDNAHDKLYKYFKGVMSSRNERTKPSTTGGSRSRTKSGKRKTKSGKRKTKSGKRKTKSGKRKSKSSQRRARNAAKRSIKNICINKNY
jgi:hypothetical protein